MSLQIENNRIRVNKKVRLKRQIGGKDMTERLTKGDTTKEANETVTDPLNQAQGEKGHVPVIEAPGRVIAGKPFEVIVTVNGILDEKGEKHCDERVELYLHNKLMGTKELHPLAYEKTESIFKIEADQALIALKEIETCRIRGVNICGKYGEKSVATNLRAQVSCASHGISEAVQEIEVLSGEFAEIEEAKDVYIKPEDTKEYSGEGP
jgi:superoxide reductase